MQARIDEGVQLCEPCEKFGLHRYCGDCGRRFVGEELTWRDCPNADCRATVTTEWCPYCGTPVVTEIDKRMEAGELDWTDLAAQASDVMRRIVRARPDIGRLVAGDDMEPTDTDLAAAIREQFGE